MARKKGLFCQICGKSLVEVIDKDDFDADETETDVGVRVGFALAGGLFTDPTYECAGCKRSGAGAPTPPPPPSKEEEEKEARLWEDPKRVKPLLEKRAARALKDAIDLDEVEELDELDDFIDKTLRNTRIKEDVITTDEFEQERRTW